MSAQYIGIETVNSLAAKYAQDHPCTPKVFEAAMGSLEARSQQATTPQLPYEANKLVVEILSSAVESATIIRNLYALLETQHTCATAELAIARAAFDSRPRLAVAAKTALISLSTPVVRNALHCQGALSHVETIGNYAWSRQAHQAKQRGAPFIHTEAYAALADDFPAVCAGIAEYLKTDATANGSRPVQRPVSSRKPLSPEAYELLEAQREKDYQRKLRERGF